MKTIIAVRCDLEASPLGTRSRLADELRGTPVLCRTVERLTRVPGAAVHLLVPASQAARLAPMVEGLAVSIEPHVAGPPPYDELVRAGRWWGLDGWRGGVSSLCAFDEDAHVTALAALAGKTGAEAVVCVPAAAPLVDPALIEAMIAHRRENREQARLTLVQAPPGLGAVIFDKRLLDELAPSGQPPGALLTYRPSQPAPDPATKETCYRAAASVIEARGRLLCDTRRSHERVLDAMAAGAESWDAAKIGGWLMRRAETHVDAVPEEIEIELTTADVLDESCLPRPRGSAVPRRGPVTMGLIERVAEGVAAYDDVRVVLGGFGEPCLHPQFGAICRLLRAAGAAAIAVRTSALWDDASIDDVLFGTSVDVIEVTLDADTPETYRRVQGRDGFERAIGRLQRWIDLRGQRRQVRPLLVPSFVKMNENLEEMEPFFDRWMERLGTAAIGGASAFAGQRPDRAVTSTTPPKRVPCRRTFSRAMVLADGRLTTCDQDFAGRQTVGSLLQTSLPDLWRSPQMAAVRSDRLSDLPLCSACREWHRP